METVLVISGDSSRLASVVSARRNLHHSGSTSGSTLQECSKSDLSDAPQLATSVKHRMLGSARLKDDSRVTSAKSAWFYLVFSCHAGCPWLSCRLVLICKIDVDWTLAEAKWNIVLKDYKLKLRRSKLINVTVMLQKMNYPSIVNDNWMTMMFAMIDFMPAAF